MDDLTARLNELEIRYTHQAQQIDELNDELIVANERIDRLERENRQLREMMSGMAPSLEESPDE
jgi:SlyX protein